MSDLPKFVELHEEGPREGFQIEKKHYPIEQRAALVEAIAEAGVKKIQVGSYVSPRAVPTMADSGDLFKIIKRKEDVRYTLLWLNEKGFQQAYDTPGISLDPKLLFYTTDEFSQRNNNCTSAEMRERQKGWLDAYQAKGLGVETAYIVTAFGCNFEGHVPIKAVTDNVQWILDTFAERDLSLPNIILADTVGWANPLEVKRRIGAVREMVPDARIGMHIHDTRGAGIANFVAAMEMGVDLFEGSVAGLGGCPFAGHGDFNAAGNVCTEDMVFIAQEMGIETGIDLDKLVDAARLAEEIIGRPLNGRVMHSGSLNKFKR
ncbi:MAG TPA: hydroxymethylglutaryl-CoA lyase [Gammaproteobacteria bacterium]|nr:hydroxymethylglutaryl-CoA lyase [Gammaproteobacteria bacterium]